MQPRRQPFPFKFPLLKGPLSQVYYKIFRQAPKLVLPQNGYPESNYPIYPSPKVNEYQESNYPNYPSTNVNGYPESIYPNYPSPNVNRYQESKYPNYPSPNVYAAYRPGYGYGNLPLNNRRNGNADEDSSEREHGENQYGSYEPVKQRRNEGGNYLNQKNTYYGAQTDYPFLPSFKSSKSEKQSSGEMGNSQKNNKNTAEGNENSDD